MNATAIIPARGGSVGVPRKNLRTVGGIPLVVRAVDAATEAGCVDRVIVSTDDPEIAAVARRAGAEVHDRWGIHAGPDQTIAQCVALVVENLDLDGPLVVIQPSSPFVDGLLVDAVLATMYDQGGDSIETVVPHRHALYDPAGRPLHDRPANRQVAPVTAWVPTGAVRAFRTFPAAGGPLSGEPMVGETHVLFDPAGDLRCSEAEAERYALDVDTPADFHVARDLASRGRILFVIAVGTDTGSGHLHRCLTLADELAHHRVEFDFGAEVEWAKEMVEARGYRMAYRGPDVLADVIVYDCLEAVDVRMVMGAQARGQRVVVLECLDADVVAQADLAVNSLYTGPPGALCGPMWEPLRPEFAIPAPVDEGLPGRRVRVLVTFGGTDPSRLTERFAEVAESIPVGPFGDGATNVRVLWPPGRDDPPPYEQIEVTKLGQHDPSYVDGPPLFRCWDGPVSDALAWADVVITSGGRTVLETAAMHRPAVVVCAHEREEHHAPVPGMIWLGHHARVSDDEVRRAVDWLIRNPGERYARAERAFRAVAPSAATVRLGQMIDGLVRR